MHSSVLLLSLDLPNRIGLIFSLKLHAFKCSCVFTWSAKPYWVVPFLREDIFLLTWAFFHFIKKKRIIFTFDHRVLNEKDNHHINCSIKQYVIMNGKCNKGEKIMIVHYHCDMDNQKIDKH